MAGCDCSKTSQRSFARLDPGPPQRQIAVGDVVIRSRCFELELPGDERQAGGDAPYAEMLCTGIGSEGKHGKKGRHGKPGKGREEVAGPVICVNELEVSLLAGSTAGLEVVELTAGGDVFALDVGVGGREVVRLSADSCEDGKASVKIVDAAGQQIAVLGGFAICKAVP